jgi:hypothetical protein
MQENKNLVEEALIQMKNVEEAIAENAKGILASTMKEEINQLVKESLSEQDDDEMDVDTDVEVDTDVDTDTDNEDDVDMDMDTNVDMDVDMDSDETPIDLTGASDEEILKVFKAMGEEDGIIIKKDGSDVTLKDNNTDSEYLIRLGESVEEEYENEMMEDSDETTKDVINAIFGGGDDSFGDETDEGVMYEIEMDEDDSMDSMEMDEDDDEETIYEIEMDEDDSMDSMEMDEDDSMDSMEMDEDDSWQMDEAYSHKKARKGIKPKGLGIGKPKFQYKKTSGGFKEDKKEGPKSVGTGKPKFEYKEGKNLAGKNKIVKKVETKESARTLGMGSNFRKGGLPKPRAHSNANTAIKESLETEVTTLREKNEEYRKALNTFREKLNEVAIFNSNLAYATRLFTEHSTTKKEKINILRRFDGVETLKESKNLYKSIKDELGKVESKPMNESVEIKINKSVSTGSSSTLIESKTYENPQFLRIKDLMGKIV